MAEIRLIAQYARKVPGLRGRVVQPDEVVTVPDAQFEAYACQTEVWQIVAEPKTKPQAKPAAAAAKAAPKTAPASAKDGD